GWGPSGRASWPRACGSCRRAAACCAEHPPRHMLAPDGATALRPARAARRGGRAGRRPCGRGPAGRQRRSPGRRAGAHRRPARVLDGADALGLGWMYWQYKTYADPTTAAASEGPDAESIVTPGGAVKAAKARELARPYPVRLAGRSAWWRHSALDGRLRLRWRATAGADTVVALPRLAYPRGFAIAVHGVRVVRRAPLTLRSAARRSPSPGGRPWPSAASSRPDA